MSLEGIVTKELRLDVDVLLGVPELLFIEFSQKYGSGGEGQLRLDNSSSTHTNLVRPLFGLNDRHPQEFAGGKPCGALLYQKAENGADSVYANLRLLRWMPEDSDGANLPAASLLHLVVGKRHTYDQHADGGKEYVLCANARLAYSEGFSFVQEPDHWPITHKLLACFGDLTSGFPFKVREKEKRYYMA